MESPKKPFLKWAGAKTQLVKKLRPLFPEGDYRFIEPFVGSGVVFLNTQYRSSLLSDSNQDIISLYSVLKRKPREFIQRCRELFIAENNFEEQFYKLRAEFNSCDNIERRASIFVYLNRHCFNGLCRYNQKGKFNTPFGRYEHVPFPKDKMEIFAEKLESAELQKADFRVVLSKAGDGDVVYCDPPYVPLTATASFTNYAAGGFSGEDQEDLRKLALEASERGAVVILSNHDTPVTRKLYRQAQVTEVMVSRTISCDGRNRNKVKEIIAVFGKSERSKFQLSL
ncbi:MAG TPA: Dam family site-specific DNA-(adenine-N6)-methyltransferase [Candidatus Limnocylindria bacterium]|nr:Dam family site-specific DNA-(adenine-N6)-methyltransferase [Candidatus Limnocylindria bacterium]